MSLTDGQLSAADVAAVVGNQNGGGGFGDFGGNNSGWWILLLFLFAMNGGWGNNGGGNIGGNGGGGAVPYITADMQRGFDQAATSAAIGNLAAQIGDGFASAAVANCQGNAATVAAITGAKDAITATLNANQNANNQGINSLAMALQQCCCENRQAISDLRSTIIQENCADRQAISDGIRDVLSANAANTNAIIQSQNAGFQSIKDKLCQLELDNVKQENERLRTQLNMAALTASQTAQTAQLLQDNAAQTANLIQRINPAPIPAYAVQNPNCCQSTGWGGCGCA